MNGSELEWPLVVRGLDGAAHTVVHQEGEAVLYEGSRLLHGRPMPLGGSQYAALFVGFVPKLYPERAGLSTCFTVNTVRRVKQTVFWFSGMLSKWRWGGL